MSDYVSGDTTTGRIRGFVEREINVFRGIPYAGRVDGAARFMPPSAPEPWTGVRDAIAYGPRAIQADNAFAMPPQMLKLFGGRELEPMNENCLVLNVWTPALKDGRKRPVMFWCHGGAFIAGSGSAPWYDGTNLCRSGDVVVVTINHRLGAFGYLHLEDLAGEEFRSSGIAGMLDIIAALRWVRDNITNFGGDAGNVTIFGESGGGAKVSVLMAMPEARGLFHRAIIQSGPAVEMASREDGSETARQLLAELNLARISDIRSIDADRIVAAQDAVLKKVGMGMTSFANRRHVGFNPIVDGKHLPSGPFAPTAPEISARIPLMIGTNKDEMTLFMAFAPWLDSLDESSARERVRIFVGDRGDAVFDAYRRARPGDSLRDLVLAIATDLAMRMPSLVTADRKAMQNAAPAYVYLFTYETPALGGRLKSPHALEIPFVFNNLGSSGLTGEAPERFELSRKMSKTWIAFARTGDPNNDSIPDWPAYSVGRRPTMIFDVNCRVENDPYSQERLAWSDRS